tara:strand:- start:10311 stop:11012 length:702 start_codon:yes stop_codon:yes gene_type:complete
MPTKCFTKKTNSGKNYTACVDTKTFKKKTKKATRKKNKITIPKMKKLSSHDAIRNVPALRNLIGSYVMRDSQQRGSSVSALGRIINQDENFNDQGGYGEGTTTIVPFSDWEDEKKRGEIGGSETEMIRQFKFGVKATREKGRRRKKFAKGKKNRNKWNFSEYNAVGAFRESDFAIRNVKRSKATTKKDRMVSARKRNDEVNRNYNINNKRKKKAEMDKMREAYEKRTRIHSLL